MHHYITCEAQSCHTCAPKSLYKSLRLVKRSSSSFGCSVCCLCTICLPVLITISTSDFTSLRFLYNFCKIKNVLFGLKYWISIMRINCGASQVLSEFPTMVDFSWKKRKKKNSNYGTETIFNPPTKHSFVMSCHNMLFVFWLDNRSTFYMITDDR